MGDWILSLIASLFVVTPLIAHDLPDGQVERAVQVTAYPDRIEVKYQFGLSERTMWQELYGSGEERDVDIGDLGREELARLEAEYLAKISGELPERIELILAGELQASPVVTTEMIYQHHLQFEFQLVYPCTVLAEPCFLELTDQNFATFPGHYRVAIRGRGGREALSDTAALLLVRAPRLPIQSEHRGRLVVPPIQATVGRDLASGGSRMVISPPSIGREEGSISSSGKIAPLELPESVLSTVVEGTPGLRSEGAAEPRFERRTAIESSAETRRGSDQAAREYGVSSADSTSSSSSSSSSRALPNWLVGGFIILVAILCLPLLFLNRRSVSP